MQSDDKAPMRDWLVSVRKDSIPRLVIFSKGDEIVGAQLLVGADELSSA